MKINSKLTGTIIGLVVFAITLYGKEPTDYQFLSKSEIISGSWEATVDYRENVFEQGVKYPFFIGDSYYSKGISIPLRESVIMKVKPGYKYATFTFGVDQFLFPETKVKCRLIVRNNDKIIYTSPEINEKSEPIRVELSVSGIDSLIFELKEASKFVFDSPNNWADLSYLGVDLVNFVWSNKKQVALPTDISDKSVNMNIGMEVKRITLPASAWAVKFIPDCGPGNNGLIMAGCFDNNLYAMSINGKILWKVSLKGVPQKIDYCFEGKDLRIGVFSWSADTDLSIIDGKGKLIKTIDSDCKIKAMTSSGTSFFTVDYYSKVREYTPSGELVRTKTLERVNGRPIFIKVAHVPEMNESLILIGTTGAFICYNSKGDFLWKKIINPINLFLSATHEAEVVTFSGKTCFAVGSRPGSVSLIDYKGRMIWRDRYVGRGHSAPEITAGAFTGTNAMEIAAVSPDGIFHLINLKGQRVKRWEKELPFVDLECIVSKKDKAKQTLFASSMGPRDKNIYLINFNTSGKDVGVDLFPDFRKDHVSPVLAEMKNDIESSRFFTENKKKNYVSFLFDPFGGNFTNTGAYYNKQSLPEVIKRLQDLKKVTDELSGNNVLFFPMFDLWSCVFHKERRIVQDASLNLEVLAEVEKIGLPFSIFIMHLEYIPMEDLREIVQQNKKTLQALHISEKDGMIEYKKEVMELAKANGLKVIFGIHRDYWVNVPQHKDEFNVLFHKDFKDILVPVVKSNPGSFDLNWMSTLGLLKKNYIAEWGVASQCWNWDWGPRNIDAMFPLDLIFRHDFQAASLGANWYLPEGDFTQDVSLLKTFFEGRKPFYDLLKKGFFAIDSLGQNKRISPIEIKYKKDPDFNFLADNRPGHFFTTGFFDGMLQTTSANSFSRDITCIERYTDALFPKMPYGFTTIIPEDESLDKVSGWSTDGKVLYKNGQKQENTRTLVAELKEAASDFLVNTEDAFLSVQEIGDNIFIYVSTIGYLYPESEEVTLNFNEKLLNSKEKKIVLTDMLKNKKITVDGNNLKLKLQPGEVKVYLYTTE